MKKNKDKMKGEYLTIERIMIMIVVLVMFFWVIWFLIDTIEAETYCSPEGVWSPNATTCTDSISFQAMKYKINLQLNKG